MSLVAILLAVIAGCGSSSSEAEPILFGLRLPAHETIPPLDVAVRVTPADTSAEQLVGPSAQMLSDALRSCTGASSPNAFDQPLSVTLTVERGRVSTPASPDESPIAQCLSGALADREATAFAGGRHEVLMQLVKAADERSL